MKHIALPVLSYDNNNLSKYLRHIHTLPTLDKDHEYELIRAWQEKKDTKALNIIIKAHLKLVARIAKGYRGYGLPISDLIAEGHIGIMQAANKFNHEKDFRFATYASWWIKSLINEYILNNWSMVKIATTSNHRKLFYNLNKMKEKLGVEGFVKDDEAEKIAQELNLSKEDVILMDQRLAGGDHSLNAKLSDAEGSLLEWQDWVIDETSHHALTYEQKQELDNRLEALREAMKCLDSKEHYVVTHRRLVDDPLTLSEISKEMGVSAERVRQIEVIAFNKLQKAFKRMIAEEIQTNITRRSKYAIFWYLVIFGDK